MNNSINWPIYKIIELLREFFSNQTIYTFDDDETNSKIQIREKNSVCPDSPDSRPILSISRGGIRMQNRFISNQMSIDGTTGEYTYVDLASTQITIDCIARSGIQSEDLAAMVFGMFKFNKPYIMSKGFIELDPPAISAEQVILTKSKIELTNVSVVFNVIYAIKWIRREKDVYTLNNIVFSTRNTEIATI